MQGFKDLEGVSVCPIMANFRQYYIVPFCHQCISVELEDLFEGKVFLIGT